VKIFTDEERHVSTSSIIDYQNMTTTTGSKELDELLHISGIGDEVRPKPVALVEKILQIGGSDNAIVVDFFAGSATTAHATMRLNKRSGNRRYVLCTLDENVKDKTVAKRNGYETIDQIARDRIVKAAEQLGDTSGFRHYRFVAPTEQTLEKVDGFDPTTPSLVVDDMITPFSEKSLIGSGSDDGVATILTTWLVDDGYSFDTKAQELDLAGYTAHYAPDIARLYLVNKDGWTKESCKQLLNLLGKNEIAVNTIVIYAYSFDFVSLTELKNNLQANLDKNIQVIERY
jgi:adenine-specific DNA-methyltransferase